MFDSSACDKVVEIPMANLQGKVPVRMQIFRYKLFMHDQYVWSIYFECEKGKNIYTKMFWVSVLMLKNLIRKFNNLWQ